MIALRTPHYLALTAAALAAAVGVWLLREFDPNAAHSPFPGCMFRALTGYFCVGCGLTRALHALVHGDLARAFSMNPLAMLLLPAIPMMIAHGQGWRPRTRRRSPCRCMAMPDGGSPSGWGRAGWWPAICPALPKP